jgi:hypothetical protein
VKDFLVYFVEDKRCTAKLFLCFHSFNNRHSKNVNIFQFSIKLGNSSFYLIFPEVKIIIVIVPALFICLFI